MRIQFLQIAKKLGKKATLAHEESLAIQRLKDLYGSLLARPEEGEMARDPRGLQVPLMAHQKHALAWMQWREQQNPRGGIIGEFFFTITWIFYAICRFIQLFFQTTADEMGLRKKLTMIALVMAEIAQKKSSDDKDNEDVVGGDDSSIRKKELLYNLRIQGCFIHKLRMKDKIQ